MMISITATMVKELRERTGAAIMACKRVLGETQGDIEKAIDKLREAGEAKVEKRAEKIVTEGVIVISISKDQKKSFIAEVNCETDFVARDPSFVAFTKKIAERGLTEEVNDVSTTLALSIKPGSSITIEEMRKELINKLSENIQIRRVASLTSEAGIVGYYTHGSNVNGAIGRIGVLIALDANSPALAKNIAMHIAASNPKAVNAEQVPIEFLKREREILLVQAKKTGKSEKIIEKMVEGRVKKLLKEVSLEGQPFVKDPDKVVGDLLKSEKAKVLEFIRFEVGEGIEKKFQSFSDKVMAQVKGNRQ